MYKYSEEKEREDNFRISAISSARCIPADPEGASAATHRPIELTDEARSNLVVCMVPAYFRSNNQAPNRIVCVITREKLIPAWSSMILNVNTDQHQNSRFWQLRNVTLLKKDFVLLNEREKVQKLRQG